MTLMEGDLNGRQHQKKTTSMEKQPQWKTTLMDDLKGRRPQGKTTSMEDNLNGRPLQ